MYTIHPYIEPCVHHYELLPEFLDLNQDCYQITTLIVMRSGITEGFPIEFPSK